MTKLNKKNIKPVKQTRNQVIYERMKEYEEKGSSVLVDKEKVIKLLSKGIKWV